jgi:branched-subunit amino acid transport protein
MSWLAIAVLALGTYGLKAAGPLLLGDRPLPDPLARLAELVPAALLAALIAVEVAAADRRLVLDERLGGFAAAAVAVALHASFLVAVVVACATTAMLRAL